MISENKKKEIVTAIIREKNLLGSYAKVATKLKISGSTISANLLKSENWRLISNEMWADIASVLEVSLVDRTWNLVPTNNLKIMHRVLLDAQKEGLFMAVSHNAGSGKSASITDFVAKDQQHSVYALQCQEWSLKTFLLRLCNELGISAGKYDTIDNLTEGIVRFFKQRSKEVSPLLILDEADKLKPAALRFLIPLYNRLEDEMGLVACGTENLENEVKKGVKKATKGYDEIDSRLGRNFVHLIGSTQADVVAICRANGVSDDEAISRVWEKSTPIKKMIGGKYINIVEDLRAVKRAIKAERLRFSVAA